MEVQLLIIVLALVNVRFVASIVAPGYTCTDINECQMGTDNCPANSKCSNTIGSYTCVCDQGYTKVNGMCKPRDVCQIDNGGCGRKKCTRRNNRASCSCETYLLGQVIPSIALGKCVKMSSQQACDFDRCYDGSHLVDGVKSGFDYNNLAITISKVPAEISPWVQIDLGENRCIVGVRILKNERLGGYRLRNVLVNMGEREIDVAASIGSAAQCFYFHGEPANGEVLTCSKRMYSRYVRVISHMSRLPMALYEVDVLGW